ncbi:SigB/SigF/SigG family RNA polymerase sigma factor [Rhodococcus qingshengii]|uniref:SigB/SigF/SigG family RNA polymerase sigma factor n=1 Tax=Rhodococcus qingshengii TaxID=334542 RepID=UPI001C8BCCBA
MAGHHHAGKGGATRLTTPQARESKDYAHVIGLFAEMAALPEDAPERERLRVHIIESCLPIAENIATRYRGRGQSHEDLVQVASVGLVNAVNRFDLDKGRDFLSFAIPTMMGEVRKHFRDRGWDVRIPRSMQENYLALQKAGAALTQSLGREPTVPELAAQVDVEPGEIAAIIAAGDSYHAASLDAAFSADGASLADSLGDFDAALDGIDTHETLRPALLALPERERTILVYRFFGQLTQTEIAEKVGISQMHVSRLLAQSLETLRKALGGNISR